jgi:drug/metabolite transporter (DMT)-like permease
MGTAAARRWGGAVRGLPAAGLGARWLGPALVAASAACVGATAVLARLAYTDGTDPRTFLAVRFAVAAAGIASAASIGLFQAGLGRIGVGDAAAFLTLEPIATLALAWAVLAEPLSATQAAGGTLILAAVVALARGSGAVTQVDAATRSSPAKSACAPAHRRSAPSSTYSSGPCETSSRPAP